MGLFRPARVSDASDIDIAIVFETVGEIESARRALYSSPRTDAWPHDLVFFTHSDLYTRAREDAQGGDLRVGTPRLARRGRSGMGAFGRRHGGLIAHHRTPLAA
jgi:hypothetical protein